MVTAGAAAQSSSQSKASLATHPLVHPPVQAHAKYSKDFGAEAPACPEVCIPDPASLCVPALPPPFKPRPAPAAREPFVWEEIDGRQGRGAALWRDA